MHSHTRVRPNRHPDHTLPRPIRGNASAHRPARASCARHGQLSTGMSPRIVCAYAPHHPTRPRRNLLRHSAARSFLSVLPGVYAAVWTSSIHGRASKNLWLSVAWLLHTRRWSSGDTCNPIAERFSPTTPPASRTQNALWHSVASLLRPLACMPSPVRRPASGAAPHLRSRPAREWSGWGPRDRPAARAVLTGSDITCDPQRRGPHFAASPRPGVSNDAPTTRLATTHPLAARCRACPQYIRHLSSMHQAHRRRESAADA
jgi:hypothetical protein